MIKIACMIVILVCTISILTSNIITTHALNKRIGKPTKVRIDDVTVKKPLSYGVEYGRLTIMWRPKDRPNIDGKTHKIELICGKREYIFHSYDAGWITQKGYIEASGICFCVIPQETYKFWGLTGVQI